MKDQRSFREGYLKGWRTNVAEETADPPIPGFVVPHNQTPYEVGHRRGVEDSARLKERT
jgi:hypothetical protein